MSADPFMPKRSHSEARAYAESCLDALIGAIVESELLPGATAEDKYGGAGMGQADAGITYVCGKDGPDYRVRIEVMVNADN